jgi:hypothetical protein
MFWCCDLIPSECMHVMWMLCKFRIFRGRFSILAVEAFRRNVKSGLFRHCVSCQRSENWITWNPTYLDTVFLECSDNWITWNLTYLDTVFLVSAAIIGYCAIHVVGLQSCTCSCICILHKLLSSWNLFHFTIQYLFITNKTNKTNKTKVDVQCSTFSFTV